MFRDMAKVEKKSLLVFFFDCLKEIYPLDSPAKFDFPTNRPIYNTYNPGRGVIEFVVISIVYGLNCFHRYIAIDIQVYNIINMCLFRS